MKRFLLIWALACSLQALGATQQVPSRMSLADIKLQLTPAGKKRVQERVDALTKGPKHLQTLIERANLFLPIVERVFQQENIPPDFKYLVLQESSFIADAVSTSKAVGFWQFKDFTAAEVGLQINGNVDERMHITTATRGAARYLKMNNQYLDNWLYSMLAYNQGRGYVERNTDCKKYKGAKRMSIDGQTHWYIVYFLAYKLVFEDKIGKERHPELYLHEYEEAHGKTLGEIAKEFGVDKEQLKAYNKWLKRHRVPHDAASTTIIPMTHEQYAQSKAPKPTQMLAEHQIDYAKHKNRAADFPVITSRKDKKSGQELTVINGIAGTVAQAGDNLETLAQAGSISVKQLLAINDIEQAHHVVPGQVYYFKSKKSKAGTHFHLVQPGETWWSVSQHYGIKKRELLSKNRLRQEVALQPWRVLWLRFIRPAKIPVAYEYPTEGKNGDAAETSPPAPDAEALSPAPPVPAAPAVSEEQDIFEPDK